MDTTKTTTFVTSSGENSRKASTSGSMSSAGSMSKPRIRILLAPYMSPYVVPMSKVETWELLMNMLGKLFGPTFVTPNLKVTDTQGNAIHMHVWEDLVEPGMTIVVDAGSSISINSSSTKIIQVINLKDSSTKEQSPTKDFLSAIKLKSSPEVGIGNFNFLGKGSGENNGGNGGGKVDKQADKPGWKDGKPLIGMPIAKQVEGGNLIEIQNRSNQLLVIPPAKSGRWAKEVEINRNDRDVEEDQETTVSMFVGKSGEQSRRRTQALQLVPQQMTAIVRKASNSKTLAARRRSRSPTGQLMDTTRASKVLVARRKRSAATRVTDCFKGIKSRYVPSITSKKVARAGKEITPLKIGLPEKSSVNYSPTKVTSPRQLTGVTGPTSAGMESLIARTYTTLPSGAISSQPPKSARKPRRKNSIRAFFGHAEEASSKSPQPYSGAILNPLIGGQTPKTTTPKTPKTPRSGGLANATIPSSTRETERAKSPKVGAGSSPIEKAGYQSDEATLAGGTRSRSGTSGTVDTVVSESNAKVTVVLPSVDKPLPKLPYKFSTFPAPTPPRSPLIKAPPQPLNLQPLLISTSTSTSTSTSSNPLTNGKIPTPTTSTSLMSFSSFSSSSGPRSAIPSSGSKIIPFSELNRRLAKDSKFKKENRDGKPSRLGSGTIHHRRNQSAASQGSAISDPTSSSRPTTAVATAEVAVNGFGMKSKLVTLGNSSTANNTSSPEQTSKPSRTGSTSKRLPGNGGGKSVRKIASDDNIHTGMSLASEARRSRIQEESKKMDFFRRPKTAGGDRGGEKEGKKMGLGIDLLEVQGGRTIAIGDGYEYKR